MQKEYLSGNPDPHQTYEKDTTMTFMNPTHSSDRSHGAWQFLSRVGSMLAGLSDSYRRYRVYQETCDALQGLSDRELADMGVNRFEIPTVAGRAAFSDA